MANILVEYMWMGINMQMWLNIVACLLVVGWNIKCFHFDTDGKPLPVPAMPPISSTKKFSHLIFVTHNESIFFQNNIRTNY